MECLQSYWFLGISTWDFAVGFFVFLNIGTLVLFMYRIWRITKPASTVKAIPSLFPDSGDRVNLLKTKMK